MAESLSSSAPRSSCSFPKVKYDVFLCFRGDTRYHFTSYLYRDLCQKGVVTFKDDRDFETGRPIDDILEDLRASRIAVVIFSEEFAASTYCLDELVTICECIDRGTQEAVPIFYRVDPSEPQSLPEQGSYKKAFDQHRQGQDLAKVGDWERAMKRVANISGKEFKKDRDEPEFIEMFVKSILDKLKSLGCGFSSLAKGFIGMDKHLERMSLYLDIENKGVVRFIVIWGMIGIGKTAIAQVVYAERSDGFEGSSFLSNVSNAQDNKSLLALQKQLLLDTLNREKINVPDLLRGKNEIKRWLHSRRVLVVLDDVDDIAQLQSLIGVGDPEAWFASGSRIIITTKDSRMLDWLGNVDKKIYEVQEGLANVEALQLFCKEAFGIGYDEPPKGFKQLSKKFVEYVDRLPLALHLIGSSLCGQKSRKAWESQLKSMEESLPQDIVNKLEKSLKGLNQREKDIFLDIAFFFNGENKDSLTKVLHSCGFHPDLGMDKLRAKSLISISDSKVLMHNLLQLMGKEFVRQEHGLPRKRSRLWLHEDVYDALKCRTREINVQGISLESGGPEDRQLSGKSFSELRRLRVLKLKDLNLSGGLNDLSDELRYLRWHGYPFKLLPSAFVPDKLVELHMPFSEIEELWKGVKQRMVTLKVIDLCYCQNIKETIDFRIVPNLEKLRLTGCRRLFEVHRSIRVLNKLVTLDLENCESLEVFPNEICSLESLQNLNLYGCPKLTKLPKLGHMESLLELQASEITIAQMPSLHGLCCLRKLLLINCSLEEDAIPEDLSCFPWLECLNLSGNHFVRLSTILHCSLLEKLSLNDCKSLQSVPDLPLHIKHLYLRNCSSLTSLQGLNKLSELEDLFLTGCKRLQSLKDLPSSINNLAVDDCTSLEAFPDPVGMCTSRSLWLSFANCKKLDEFQVLLAWLKCYFQTLTENKHERNRELSILLPKSTILGLCKSHGTRSYFDVHLAPNWCNDDFMGFWICAVLDFQEPPASRVKGDLFAYREQPKQGQYRKRLGEYYMVISLDDCASDQLWFLFIPHDKSRSVDWWNAFTLFKFEASIAYLELEVRCWGFSMMYEQDVKKLMGCDSSEELDLPCGSESKKRKRSDDDNTSGDEVDLSRNGNFLKFVLNDFSDDSDDEDEVLASYHVDDDMEDLHDVDCGDVSDE